MTTSCPWYWKRCKAVINLEAPWDEPAVAWIFGMPTLPVLATAAASVSGGLDELLEAAPEAEKPVPSSILEATWVGEFRIKTWKPSPWLVSMGRMTTHIWNGNKMFETTNQTRFCCGYMPLQNPYRHLMYGIWDWFGSAMGEIYYIMYSN